MKITSIRLTALAFLVIVMSFVSSGKASAAYVSIRVGTPPPPVIVERPWARPYRGAVWIPGHNEWVRGGWVWVAGYWTYPPRRGGYWVGSRYRHGYYYPGHWAY
jgi:hypothetical protein